LIQSGHAFAPGHVTGFFQIKDTSESLDKRGSRGAGFCTGLGVITEVEVTSASELEVTVHDKEMREDIDAPTTRRAVTDLLELAGKRNGMVRLVQESQLPSGQGCGISGAAALSGVLAVSSTLELELPYEDVVACAHRAEVAELTGLGDVVAQASGGFEIRVHEGAPGHGRVISKDVDCHILLCTLGGPLSTKTIIADADMRERINEVGELSMSRLLRLPEDKRTIWEFISVSRDFAHQSALITNRMEDVLDEVEDLGPGSMAMLGNTVFVTPRSDDHLPELRTRLERFGVVFQTKIENRRAHPF